MHDRVEPGTAQMQRRLRLLFFLVCLVLTFVFFHGPYLSTEGLPSLPTDDAYIYFQYARQLAEGHPFQYNTGDEPTTGMTSILYWLLMSFGYIIGFRGELQVVLAFLVGFAGLLASVWLVYRICAKLLGHSAGIAAAFLFCLNGQVVWGYLAGLEIPLFTSVLLVSIYSFLEDSREGRLRRTMVACGLLSLSRPEGLILGCSLALLLAAVNFRNGRLAGRRIAGKKILWIALPFLTSLGYLIMNKAVAGHLSPTTASTKSMWNSPDLYKISYAAGHFILDSMRGLFGASYPATASIGFSGTSTVPYFAPFALLFFILGSFTGVASELRKREVNGFTLLLAVFGLGLGFVAFTSSFGFQHHRYLIPFYPVFIIGMTAGVYRFARWVGHGLKERVVRSGLVAYFLLLTCFGLLTTFTQYVFECVMIQTTTVQAAEWVRENLTDDDVLAMVDAGILKYYGEKRTVDLLGLTTRRFFGKWVVGWGAVVEELSHMPETERPTHLAIMPSFGKMTMGIEPLYSVLDERVYEPWLIYLSGQAVSRTDYAALDAGARPRFDSSGWFLVDSLDVGFVADEERCGYRTLFRRPAFRLDVGLHSASYDEEPETADCGRVILRGERFSIATVPGRALRVVLRSSKVFRTYRYSPSSVGYLDSRVQDFNPVTLLIDGRKMAGAGISTPSGDRWHETVLEVPAEFIETDRTTIEILGSYNSFHYWFYQRPD